MNWLKNRLNEPSTHAGIAGLLLFAKGMFPNYSGVLDSLAALFASVAVVKADPAK